MSAMFKPEQADEIGAFIDDIEDTAKARGFSPGETLVVFGLFARYLIDIQVDKGAHREKVTAAAVEQIMYGLNADLDGQRSLQ